MACRAVRGVCGMSAAGTAGSEASSKAVNKKKESVRLRRLVRCPGRLRRAAAPRAWRAHVAEPSEGTGPADAGWLPVARQT